MAKPPHLAPRYGAQFRDESVVAAYRHRPPYTRGLLAFLRTLVKDRPARILDLGSGRGEIARPLARVVEAVEAVEPSRAMVAAGMRLAGGARQNLRWLVEPAETASWTGPYALITAGNSLHWMDWDVVLPRLARALTENGSLAIVGVDPAPPPWQTDLLPLIRRYSTNQDFRPYHLVNELTARHLFQVMGERDFSGQGYRRSIAAYVEDFHSRNGFSRERMTVDAARAFDHALREVVARFAEAGHLQLSVSAHVVWGRPLDPARQL